MRFANDELRNRVAAEYVLGTLSARARRRIGTALKINPQLRRAVSQWEARLAPLADVLPEIEPPPRVWQAIQARIQPPRTAKSGLWENLSFWRISSFASGLLVLALLVFVALPEPRTPEAGLRMIVVMTDLETRNPAMTATWEPGKPGERVMRVRVIGHAEMAPDTAWELWMLPGGNRKPVSLGLISTDETQTVVVPAPLAARLDTAEGLAMSVEPAGGSPTGLPTGPVLYAGPCVKA